MFVSDAGVAIDLMGGTTAVQAMFKDVKRGTVSMWRSRGFPAQAWQVLAPQLKRRRILFNPYDLFNMLEPADGGRDG